MITPETRGLKTSRLHFNFIKNKGIFQIFMSVKYWAVAFEDGEFENKFPEIAAMDLRDSDKVRVALGLEARQSKGGAPKGNKNAVGNKGRWIDSQKNKNKTTPARGKI